MVLDASSGKPVAQPVASENETSWVTYSPDGSLVVTSGGAATDAIWDGVTGELLARVATPERFTVAGFGQDLGSVVIVSEFGGPVFRWDTRLERAVEFACRVAGRDFTEKEWSDHFGDRPYQHTCPRPGA